MTNENRSPLDLGPWRELADQQLNQAEMLTFAIQAAITNPHRIVHLQVCAVAYNADEQLLMLGQPNGERIDVPLNAATRRMLLRELAGGDDGEEVQQ